MNKYLISSFLFLLAASVPASSQDLNSLRDRASRLWVLRLQANQAREADAQALKSKAADFVEKEGRSNMPMYENVQEAAVAGLEFTEDKSKVLVTTKAKTSIPAIGKAEQTIVESWVWKGGNWFVHIEPVALKSFLQSTGTASAITGHLQGFTFQLLDKKIDLGAHKQGDKISGTVKFAAARSDLQSIRARGMDGFRIGATRWIDDKTGEMDFDIDSSLISQDIDTSVVFEAIGPERIFEVNIVTEKLALVGRIEGKFRISQLPQTPEAEKGRFIELEVKNVGNASFRIEQIRSLDANFVVAESAMPVLAPGQTTKITASYPGQAHLVDGELILHLSEGVLPSNRVIFRIKGPTPQTTQQQPRSLTRTEADAALQKAKEDAERERARQK